MAKNLKFFWEYRSNAVDILNRVEIYVEGFSGTATELDAASGLTININKDVGEKYLGGLAPNFYKLSAFSTSAFKAVEFKGENYGDAIVRFLEDDVLKFNAVIVPFEGSDLDAADGFFGVDLSAECGLNYLKTVNYPSQTGRKKLIEVLKTCLAQIPIIDTFNIEVIDNTLAFEPDFVSPVNYWDTYVDAENFKDKDCLTVVGEIRKPYNEITFSNGVWLVRNIKELSTQNSLKNTYTWSTLAKTATLYTRPTITPDRLSGNFGLLFSQKNLKVSKGASRAKNQFQYGEFNNLTGWSYSGTAGLWYNIVDNKLWNSRSTFFTPNASPGDNTYIQSPSMNFQPFSSLFVPGNPEKERLIIRGLANIGRAIKNLRLQIIVSANGIDDYLSSEGTWYTPLNSDPTPIYELKVTDGTEWKIELPQVPFHPAGWESTVNALDFGVNGYANNPLDAFVPTTNLTYSIKIRIFLPERVDDLGASTVGDYGSFYDVYLDYLRIDKADSTGNITTGFTHNFGAEGTKDRQNDFTIDIGVGYPSYPIGLDCLFKDTSTTTQIVAYGEYGTIVGGNIDEYIAQSYLDVLGNRLKTWEGTIIGVVRFGDLLLIDGLRYRIHNYSYDTSTNMSSVKAIELASESNSLNVTIPDLDEETKMAIDDYVKKNIGASIPMIFADKNIFSALSQDGQQVIGLRPNPKFNSIFTEETFLKADNGGKIKDVAANTASDFTLIKPAENGTYATREWTEGNFWELGGNVATTALDFGTTSGNFDIRVLRNNLEVGKWKSYGLLSPSISVAAGGTYKIDESIVLSRSGNYTVMSDKSGNPSFFLGNAADPSNYFQNNNHVFRSRNAATNYATINAAGVAMGTVFDNTTKYIGKTNGGVFGQYTAWIGFESTTSEDMIHFNTFKNLVAGGKVMTIRGAGKVGIMTEDPTEILDVNGTIKATGFKLPTGAVTGYVLKVTDGATGTASWQAATVGERWKGTWNASSGSAPSGSPTEGDYYTVIIAGTYSGVTYAVNDYIFYNGSAWVYRPNGYSLVIASAGTLGGIRVGTGLSIDGSGILSRNALSTADIGNLSSYTGFDARYQPIGSYLTSNQTITLSGIIEGSGVTAITTSIADNALSIAKINGLQSALDGKQAIDATITALAGLDSMAGFVVQTGVDTFTKRNIIGVAGRTSITNYNGFSGNIVVDISTGYLGQSSITTVGTITTGTWNGSVIPINHGGTGSATQNFVDLTTIQSIDGAKTFLSGITTNGGVIASGVGSFNGGLSVGIGRVSITPSITYNSISGASRIQSGSSTYYDYKPLVFTAKNYVMERGSLKLGGFNGFGSTGTVDFATERLDVDGNIRVSGVIKPSNIEPAEGQFLKGINATNMTWAALGHADISNLATYTGFDSKYLHANNATSFKASANVLGVIAIGATMEVDIYGIINQKSGIVTPGTYTKVSVDTYGRVTTGGSLLPSDILSAFPSGTAGQFLVRNASNNLDFMNLELEPQSLSYNKIAVGDGANYLSEYENFEYREGRYVAIFKDADPTKAFYFGMNVADNNSFVTASGGYLKLKGDAGIYLDGFAGFGTRMVIVDGDGKLTYTDIPSGGSGGGSTTLAASSIGFGSPTNLVTGVPKFRWLDDRVIQINNSGSSNIEIGRKISTENYGLFVNNGDLELFTNQSINASIGSTGQFKIGNRLKYLRSTNAIQLDSDYIGGPYLSIGNSVSNVFSIRAVNGSLMLEGVAAILASPTNSYLTFQTSNINWQINSCVNGWSGGAGTPQEGDEVTLIFSGGEFKLKRKV